MASVPNIQDAFVGTEIIIHLAQDKPLDVERFKAALKKHKVKLKKGPRANADYIL